MKKIKNLLPGLILVLTIATLVQFGHQYLSITLQNVCGKVVLGMLIGLIISNVFSVSPIFKDGIRLCFGHVLKAAIVLLGVKISLSKIAEIGGPALLLIVTLIMLALVVTYYLGKWLKISPKLAALIGIGTAVCGNTAISAIAPAIQAKDEEMSFAIAVNTLFGTCAVFLYPLLGEYLQLSDPFFGFWAGTAVNDTSQVAATGLSYSDGAYGIAMTVKLTRNALMGFVMVAMIFMYGEKNENEEKPSILSRLKLPTFVVLFLVVATANTFGFFTWLNENIYEHTISDIGWLVKFFILMALVGVGLNTQFSSMKKIGIKPFIVGLSVAMIISITSFSLVYFLSAFKLLNF